jgi:hypothetical protein
MSDPSSAHTRRAIVAAAAAAGVTLAEAAPAVAQSRRQNMLSADPANLFLLEDLDDAEKMSQLGARDREALRAIGDYLCGETPRRDRPAGSGLSIRAEGMGKQDPMARAATRRRAAHIGHG